MIDGVNLVAETQNARVAYLTVFTIISLGLLSVAQVYYLRRFFQVSNRLLGSSSVRSTVQMCLKQICVLRR